MIIVEPYVGYELGPQAAGCLDFDNDGAIDLLDNDYDNDDIPEDVDYDKDGIPDALNTDTDNDGIPDYFDDDDEEMPDKDVDGDSIQGKDDLNFDCDDTLNNYDDGHDNGDEYKYDLPKGLIRS